MKMMTGIILLLLTTQVMLGNCRSIRVSVSKMSNLIESLGKGSLVNIVDTLFNRVRMTTDEDLKIDASLSLDTLGKGNIL